MAVKRSEEEAEGIRTKKDKERKKIHQDQQRPSKPPSLDFVLPPAVVQLSPIRNNEPKEIQKGHTQQRSPSLLWPNQKMPPLAHKKKEKVLQFGDGWFVGVWRGLQKSEGTKTEESGAKHSSEDLHLHLTT